MESPAWELAHPRQEAAPEYWHPKPWLLTIDVHMCTYAAVYICICVYMYICVDIYLHAYMSMGLPPKNQHVPIGITGTQITQSLRKFRTGHMPCIFKCLAEKRPKMNGNETSCDNHRRMISRSRTSVHASSDWQPNLWKSGESSTWAEICICGST